MYRLGRALGNMLGRLHANQIFYNDTILSDPSGRSHLLVSSNGDCRLIDFGVSLLLDRHPQLSREEVYNFVRTLPVFPILSGMGTDSDEMGQFLDQYQQRLTYASKAEIIARDLRFTREGLRLAARFMGSHIIDPFQQGFGETYKLDEGR
jgi:tRNA A-37 threonylcarbamoyl transferase component Bud32